jgi:hypothetical protein
LLKIPFASLVLVHLAYTVPTCLVLQLLFVGFLLFLRRAQQPLLPEGVEGFGYLVPAIERQPILGVQFNSSAFPQQDPRVLILIVQKCIEFLFLIIFLLHFLLNDCCL